MIETQTFNTVFADCIGSLGAGILLGVIYHVLRFVTGNSKKATPIRDIFFAPLAALLCYSYAVTYSFSAVLRWYILLFIGLGLLFYRETILKPLFIKEKVLKRQVVVPVGIAKNGILYIVTLTKNKLHLIQKKIENSQKKQKKQLHNKYKMLYNSDITNQFSKEEHNKFGKNDNLSKKEKGKSYIKTCHMFFCGLFNFHADRYPDKTKSNKRRCSTNRVRNSAHPKRDKRA